jgi:hypothetical protein
MEVADEVMPRRVEKPEDVMPVIGSHRSCGIVRSEVWKLWCVVVNTIARQMG